MAINCDKLTGNDSPRQVYKALPNSNRYVIRFLANTATTRKVDAKENLNHYE